jgi:hypothetical protein
VAEFLYGIAVCSAGGASVFFLKYWRATTDRFFLFFAAAFASLAVNWSLLAVYHPAGDYRYLVYLWRLLGFGFILTAIWDKNRSN